MYYCACARVCGAGQRSGAGACVSVVGIICSPQIYLMNLPFNPRCKRHCVCVIMIRPDKDMQCAILTADTSQL